ncbi:MAG TPA: cytidylate kinase-like family protein [Gemmatimonadaceae bacterium]|jgi:cytidylate kinase|nr:cytidylate kinase-like family protein [Gemmatimonadaceae bacterium]
MPIITVSRQYGSGGSEVAERVARALGWHLYDNDVVNEVARRLGMSSEDVSAREERVPSLPERIASAMALGMPEVMPTVADLAMHPDDDRILGMTQRVMEEAVLAGPAVLVGRGAQCLLATRADALHVFCYAPFDALVSYAITNLGVARADARRVVEETNHQREQFVKRHWKRNWRDVANYHICVNTAWLGLDGAAELVVQVAKERFG